MHFDTGILVAVQDVKSKRSLTWPDGRILFHQYEECDLKPKHQPYSTHLVVYNN
jgi:hypothetical protein